MRKIGSRRPGSRKNIRKSLLKKRKPGTGFLIQIIIFTFFLAAAVFLLLSLTLKGKRENSEPNETVGTESPSTAGKQEEEEKATAERTLMIDGIPVTGLSKEAAKAKILAACQWEIKLSYQDSAAELKSPLPESLDQLLSEIYSQEESLRLEHYELDTASMETSIREQVAAVSSKWNRSPARSQLTGRDKEKGSWIYTSGENGIKINQEAAVQEIMGLLDQKKFTATIAVQAEEIIPEFSAAEVKQQYQVIGTFSTTAVSSRNRNNNISLAMNALDGLVIFPGEEFSFNKTTGNRTTERGYLPAGAYRNGEFVEEPGGGVCQVSSTLYNAIIFSGIRTTERNPHSFEPSYVIPGEDAMVSYDGYSGPDLRFVNNQNTSVAIRAVFEDKKLTVSIIGIPILDDGVEISMRSQKTKEYDPPTPKYEEDQTLQPGQEIVVQDGVRGTTWKTWLVTSKDGKVMNEEYFHTSTYRGKPGIAKRNTSGVVIPPTEESETAAPTEAETAPSAGVETAPSAGVETAPSAGAETAPSAGIPFNNSSLEHSEADAPSVPVYDSDYDSESGPGIQ